ncbi:MAG: proprotein convertase P-domain-containing protein [Anaerolineales bacterium]|nr:proprotein convertase P-domain-containing protein [Anaerolineales bacterium]
MLPRVLAAVALFGSALTAGAGAGPPRTTPAVPKIDAPRIPAGSAGLDFLAEVEPNDTPGQAAILPGAGAAALGNLYPAGDVDYYAFTAGAGDRLYAAVMTSFSASGNADATLQVIAADGATVLETDLDDGAFRANAPSLAGTPLAEAGTYYLRVAGSATNTIRPYHLHVRVQSGSPAAELEPNDSLAAAPPLPASGWVAGSTASTADSDWYSLALQAGDTLFASLDLDPERDNQQWNGQLGLGLFGNYVLIANDTSTGGFSNPLSEAHFITVRQAGTYYVQVSAPPAGVTSGTYHLSVSVQPRAAPAALCTTYPSTAAPQVIPTGPGQISATLAIPDDTRIADLDVSLSLTHTRMADLDVTLTSPAGNEIGLFTDAGNSVTGSPNVTLDLVLDDEAALPLDAFEVLDGLRAQPKSSFRLDWFDGEAATGAWTLTLRDDSAGDGGRLLSWALTVCAAPLPPVCPAGTEPLVLLAADFESGATGFTHSGSADEWELGLPSYAPLTRCNSGAHCWVTDLDNTYEPGSSQDLYSPSLALDGAMSAARVSWAQQYQLENAAFDHSYAAVQPAGGGAARRLWEWLGPNMNVTVGSPPVTVPESAGWGVHTADLSGYLGQTIALRFHLESDTIAQFAGLAIDDVRVTACLKNVFPLYVPWVATGGL